MSSLNIVILILILSIIAFIYGKIPFSLVSMGIIIALILSGTMTPSEAFSGFINKNVIMLVAMFVIGEALTKTSLLHRTKNLAIRYSKTPRKLIFIASIVSAFLACITNATVTTTIMLPLIIAISNDTNVSRSKLLYPVIMIANIATGLTVLGQGAGNMAWNEVMIKAGAQNPFTLLSFPVARLPILVVAILYVTFIGYRLMPDNPNTKFEDYRKMKCMEGSLSPRKEKIGFFIISITILCMLLSSSIGIEMYMVACIGAMSLLICGILNEQEAVKAIKLPTIFLFAGVLVLADAIKISGAGDVVANLMISMMGNTSNPYVIMVFFFFFPLVMTQVMSNVACIAIFVPLASTVCVKLNADPRAAVMGVLIAGCLSVLSPIAAPCQAMIMEPGGYTMKDYFKCGLPIVLIISVIIIFYLPTLYPFY